MDYIYKLSNLVSIFNMTCSQFASVIYHGFRMLYGTIGKFTKGFQLVRYPDDIAGYPVPHLLTL